MFLPELTWITALVWITLGLLWIGPAHADPEIEAAYQQYAAHGASPQELAVVRKQIDDHYRAQAQAVQQRTLASQRQADAEIRAAIAMGNAIKGAEALFNGSDGLLGSGQTSYSPVIAPRVTNCKTTPQYHLYGPATYVTHCEQ